jgi:hypothetical protein
LGVGLTFPHRKKIACYKNSQEASSVVLRRIFRPKRDEVTDWRKLHNEELHNLYVSPNIIRMINQESLKKSRMMMRWAGHVARMWEKRNAYMILVGKPEGRKPLGRQRRRWVDNIKIDVSVIGWDGVDWVCLAQDRDQWRAPQLAASQEGLSFVCK